MEHYSDPFKSLLWSIHAVLSKFGPQVLILSPDHRRLVVDASDPSLDSPPSLHFAEETCHVDALGQPAWTVVPGHGWAMIDERSFSWGAHLRLLGIDVLLKRALTAEQALKPTGEP